MEKCMCGHLKIQHWKDKFPNNYAHKGFWGWPQNFCFEKVEWKDSVIDCPCREYTPDNLSYIEALAKQKGLI
jgi:hypothetical protein